MNFTIKIFITIICLIGSIILPGAGNVCAQDSAGIDTAQNKIIDRITIEGNKKTKDKIILLYMGIDSGDMYDTAKISLAEQNLKASGLFKDVKILSVISKNKASLWVMLTENQYFRLSDIGGVIYDRKYGEKTENIWIQVYSTVSLLNFRGLGEVLDISGSIWTSRSFGLSFYKPFIPSPYYLKTGFSLGSNPLLTLAMHCEFYGSVYTSFGRRIEPHSNIYTTLQARYSNYDYKGTDLNTESKINIIKSYEKPFSEVYWSLNWISDYRNADFDPHSGYYFRTGILTNALWPYEDIQLEEDDLRFLQVNYDVQAFHRGIWENNTIAYRFRVLNRFFGKGNLYNGIYMGSESSLRGYGHGAFGGWYNQRVLFSWEYRFPLFKLPEMQFPWLAWYDKSLNNLQTRIDGALILDCGYLWKDLLNLQHPNKDNEHAAGTGFGIRFMFPGMKRSVCAEAIWPIFYPDRYGKKLEKKGVPVIYLYLDLPF